MYLKVTFMKTGEHVFTCGMRKDSLKNTGLYLLQGNFHVFIEKCLEYSRFLIGNNGILGCKGQVWSVSYLIFVTTCNSVILYSEL